LEQSARDTHYQLQTNERDNDYSDYIMPLIITVILLCGDAICNENRKSRNHSSKGDEEAKDGVDIDAEGFKLEERE
jgi:hypothetical protein